MRVPSAKNEARIVGTDADVDADAPGNKPSAPMLPTELILLPLADRPFFPVQTLPVLMHEAPWRESIDQVGHSEHRLAGVVLIKTGHPEQASVEDFYDIGTVVRVHHPVVAAGKVQFIAEGLHRFRIREWLSRTPPYRVRVDYPQEPQYRDGEQLKAYALAILNTAKEIGPHNPLYADELKFFLSRFNPNEPSALADFAASFTTASREELQAVLDQVHLRPRIQNVLGLVKKELEVARLQAKIRRDVDEKISEHQRKFFLREQMKAIQRELGLVKDDRSADAERFRERLAKRVLPEHASARIQDELDKLGVLEPGSPEYGVTRNYLDALSAYPWGEYSKDQLDLNHARKILAREHAGLADVKERIIEFLAVGAVKGEVSGSIILLLGPPGVGKTSIGRSIANTLGRKFFRFSVGGMRDEAEIKGHRRTYIGAMPGKIAQALRECGTQNPVLMLDEIDKIGGSYQGDPASALLEVLDPEQNQAFLDHYLDVRIDLSKVLFVCTANQLDSIPRALLDRMEIIRLSGYIAQEKWAIAKTFLWPRLLQRAGLKSSDIRIDKAALLQVIDGYAREAGVRNLEKQLARIVRKVVVEQLAAPAASVKSVATSVVKIKAVNINAALLPRYLGPPLFSAESLTSGIGISTGLAWTALGGATLSIETAIIHRRGPGLKLTGTLGEVMKESAEIAYSYVLAHLTELGANAQALDDAFIHLHVPEGATPKDGPSAGITIATALLSLALQKIPKPYAMTGEITLTGAVLAVGGIREKIVAARRAKIKKLIVPSSCRGDIEELPTFLRRGLRIHFVSHYQEVAALAFAR